MNGREMNEKCDCSCTNFDLDRQKKKRKKNKPVSFHFGLSLHTQAHSRSRLGLGGEHIFLTSIQPTLDCQWTWGLREEIPMLNAQSEPILLPSGFVLVIDNKDQQPYTYCFCWS